jgi:hypothetical protein
MLLAAALRGVLINIVVYKEVRIYVGSFTFDWLISAFRYPLHSRVSAVNDLDLEFNELWVVSLRPVFEHHVVRSTVEENAETRDD